MSKILLIFTFFIYANAINPISLQYMDIEVKHTYLNKKEEIYKIQREINKNCLDIPISAESFSDDNISKNIPKECKKTFITTSGIIQPLFINEQIKTLSEIEVLEFIYSKSSKNPKSYALVDTRKPVWFNQQTIPGSINVPFEDLIYDEDFKDEFYKAYENLGIKIIDIKKNKFDFSNAKIVVFFCNGPWCPISTKTINYFLDLGYPANKMMWYRGGMSEWNALSLTVTKQMK
jgi:rhodanese-related sulfurtransferase